MANPTTPQNATAPLTQEQWNGLARLGDLGNRIGAWMDGPLGGPATETIQRLGELDAEYDLAPLAEKTVAMLHALNRAGVLDMIRDNTPFLTRSLATLQPWITQWLERAGELPAEDLKADVAFALGLLRKTRIVSEFVDEKLAGELTGKLVDATAFVQAHHTDEAIADVLVQLGRIHRSGLLPRLADLAEYASGLDEGTDLPSQLGDLVRALPEDAIERSRALVHGARDALADAGKDEKHLGGYSGMLHLLRDKEVQKGLRVLSVLPLYLEKHNETEPSP